MITLKYKELVEILRSSDWKKEQTTIHKLSKRECQWHDFWHLKRNKKVSITTCHVSLTHTLQHEVYGELKVKLDTSMVWDTNNLDNFYWSKHDFDTEYPYEEKWMMNFKVDLEEDYIKENLDMESELFFENYNNHFFYADHEDIFLKFGTIDFSKVNFYK